jgi:hypothetical protein
MSASFFRGGSMSSVVQYTMEPLSGAQCGWMACWEPGVSRSTPLPSSFMTAMTCRNDYCAGATKGMLESDFMRIAVVT